MKYSSPSRPELVGKRLLLTREALSYTSKKDFYAPLGVGASAHSMWEAGTQSPSITNAVILCREYGLTLDWIFRGDISSLPHKTAVKIRAHITKQESSDDEDLNFIFHENLD